MKYFFLILFVIGVSPSSFGQAPIPTNPNGAIEQQLKTLMQTEYTAVSATIRQLSIASGPLSTPAQDQRVAWLTKLKCLTITRPRHYLRPGSVH